MLATVKLTAMPVARTRRRAVVMSVTEVTATAVGATPREEAMDEAKPLRAAVVNVPDVRPASVRLLDTLYSVTVGAGDVDVVVVPLFRPTPRPMPSPRATATSTTAATSLPVPFPRCCCPPPGSAARTTTAGCFSISAERWSW